MPMPEPVKLRLIGPDGSSLRAMAPSLQQQGYVVRQCSSPYRAMLAQRAEPCPLVVIDANHTRGEDEDFFAILRDDEQDVFVLAVLSEQRREKVPELLRMGADACLAEPFFPDELHSTLSKAVERGRRYVRQDQLVELRLKGLAHFASAVAHEINNPLSVISGWLQVLMSDAPADGSLHNTYAALQAEADRISSVVRDLLAVSGQAAPNRVPVDMNHLIEEVVSSVQDSSSNGQVKVLRHLAPDLPAVLANESQLKEACRHLVERAWRSASQGGDLRIDTASLNGDHVEVRLHDSGPILSAELQQQLFDPFLAAEQAAQPDGLGLCVSYGIVRGLGGHLAVNSAEGEGTTFVMTLPASG